MNNKAWAMSFLALTLALLVAAATLTGVVDPFFHYHAPLEKLEYPIDNQRYQNDGIVKHFSYDALITGTSLTENFKTSEFDALFGTNAVKVCYSGGTYAEITANLQTALDSNPNIRYVLYGLDEWNIYGDKELILADGEYPTYLYDGNLLNDVQYLLNKDIFTTNTIEVLDHTRKGGQTTSFDDYSTWEYPTGKTVVLAGYNRVEKTEVQRPFTEEMAQTLRQNLENNIVALAKAHPDTQFLYFFPLYSILNWDAHVQEGILGMHIDAMTLASEILTGVDNIQLYSFYTDYETCSNFDNYRDIVHYHSGINSLLLQRMHAGEYRLTRDNYLAHWDEVREYYSAYDYDSLFCE
jgi:hypothetical protein